MPEVSVFPTGEAVTDLTPVLAKQWSVSPMDAIRVTLSETSLGLINGKQFSTTPTAIPTQYAVNDGRSFADWPQVARQPSGCFFIVMADPNGTVDDRFVLIGTVSSNFLVWDLARVLVTTKTALPEAIQQAQSSLRQ